MHILKPLIPHMILTVMLGVMGYLAITTITVLGGMAILQWSGFAHYQTFSLLIGGIIAAGVYRHCVILYLYCYILCYASVIWLARFACLCNNQLRDSEICLSLW